MKSRWVNAGESLISRPSVRAVAKKTEGKSGNTMIKLVTEDPAYGKVEGGEARIIRHKPTHAENIVSKPYHERPRGKAFTRLGLAAAGLAVAATVSSLFGADASKNREIKSAHELVLPAGTKMQNGIEQAEGHFKEPELSRSRKAFEAYLAGDMEALRNQAKAQGYESNWMKGEAITAVEQAKTYEELVAAFDKAFDGLPVKLKIYEAGKNEPEGTVGRYEHEPASNFNSARQLALATVRLFNVMDKEYLQKGMKPLNYIIVGDITDTQKEKDPPGYHVSERDLSYIVLSDQGSAHERLVGHETGHYQDLSNGYWGLPGSVVGSISSKVSELHTGQYVGPLPENYEGAKTKVEGWNSVADPYGNADAGEDTATLLETMNRTKPVMRWENSPFGEKQMAIIFEMERKYPGFTASFLERTTTDHQWETGADIRDAMLKMEGLIKPSVAGAMLTLLALAGRRARSVYSRMTATAFGLYPKRGQIAANPAEVISIS